MNNKLLQKGTITIQLEQHQGKHGIYYEATIDGIATGTGKYLSHALNDLFSYQIGENYKRQDKLINHLQWKNKY